MRSIHAQFIYTYIRNIQMNSEEYELIENFYESLHINYPKMMQKSSIRNLEIRAGWIHLIDALCKQLYSSYERAENRLAYALKSSDINKGQETIDELQSSVQYEEQYLPSLLQIKEKFGRLQIYANVFKESHAECISLVQELSSTTCEECGARGILRSSNWLRTLCDSHYLKSDI